MADDEQRLTLRDATVIRGLAHPLRVRLLFHLMAEGPATATECADAVGESPSNCSWHLRQLAGHGLVEPVPGADGRQRPWRARAVGFGLDALARDPAVRTAQAALVTTEVNEHVRRVQEYLERRDELPEDWQRAAALQGYGLRVTAGELEELTARIDELLRPYRAPVRPDAPAGARTVHVALHALPDL